MDTHSSSPGGLPDPERLSSDIDSSKPNQINVVIASIIQQLEDDQNVDIDKLVEKYPEFQTELNSYFEISEKLDDLVRSQAPTPEQDHKLPEIDGFRMIQKVGKGGMGIVYHAYQESMERDVALKFLPNSFLTDQARLRRFRFEATIAGRINESHVLPVYDILLHNKQPVLVLPYIAGGDLGQLIRQRKQVLAGELEPDQAHPWASLATELYTKRILAILDQVAKAVSVIHHYGIMHRDIKPSNILLDENGTAWLTDFGLARLADQDTITVDGAVLGTPGFMSPEQAKMSSAVDYRSDVFSLGVSFYNVLTLSLPYEIGVISSTQDSPRDLHKKNRFLEKNICDVITKSLSPNKRYRYASGQLFHSDWRLAREGQNPKNRPPVSRRTKWVVYSIFAAFLMTLVGTILFQISQVPKNDKLIAEILDGKQTVFLKTVPEADRAVMIPMDATTGKIRSEQKINLKKAGRVLTAEKVSPGFYLVVVEKKGHGFHEVFRTVPEISVKRTDDALWHLNWIRRAPTEISLPRIEIPKVSKSPVGMTLVPGKLGFVSRKSLEEDASKQNEERIDIAPFYMDQEETTGREYFQHLFRFANDIPFSTGLAHNPPPRLTDSVSALPFDHAIALAELKGKRLPSVYQHQCAAKNGGTTRFPWGNSLAFLKGGAEGINERFIQAEKEFDKSQHAPPIRGLFSGVSEWTSTYPYAIKSQSPRRKKSRIKYPSDLRLASGHFSGFTSGVPPQKIDLTTVSAYEMSAIQMHDYHLHVGMRCVRSLKPRYLYSNEK